jgi:hypothetical protein
MDDFNITSLHESKNEWCARLITILTPFIIEGYKSIFDESYKLCRDNNELDKYLMTFQNFISRVPKWNSVIIEQERKRICEKSGCNYLEDLVTCVHIIQLKILTSMRAGNKPKKIEINIPKLDEFIHKTYINVARKLYKNVYLFEINISPLQIQKHNRETEIIVQECILNTIRESIPVETILKAYMDETIEEEVIEEIKEQIIDNTPPLGSINPEKSGNLLNINNETIINKIKNNEPNISCESKLSFNNIDYIRDENNNDANIDAPKSIQKLEELSDYKKQQRQLENDNIKIVISDQNINLDNFDIQNIDNPEINSLPDLLIDDIEYLS